MSRKELQARLVRIWKGARRTTIFLLGFTLVVLLLSRGARAQLGLDPCCAIISAGLNTISGLLRNVVAKPLASIQQVEQEIAKVEQQVVYPVSAINSARAAAGQIQAQLRQMSQIYRIPTNSATLPAPQRLEQMILSHDPSLLPRLEQSYASLYGPAIAASDAPQPIRDVADMTDAEVQAALKKAVELDALADLEMRAADEISGQLQNAAPGSAPLLEAQASAWLVRANAYTQSAIAELVRLRSIDLANAGAQLKFSAAHTTTLRNTTGQVLGRGAH
jgi:hypothetical protein